MHLSLELADIITRGGRRDVQRDGKRQKVNDSSNDVTVERIKSVKNNGQRRVCEWVGGGV